MNSPITVQEEILIVDDDDQFRRGLVSLLQGEGFSVADVSSGEDALLAVSERRIDLILSDLVMETMTGTQLLTQVRKKNHDIPVILMTGHGSIQNAVEAMREGACDYLTKPFKNEELIIRIRRALQDRRNSRELKRLREVVEETFSLDSIVSENEKMRDVFKLVRQVAETDVTVLVLGETGTGKELISRAIHFNSPRKSNPLVTINCSAIPEHLIESELFGHEKGAFTGANNQRTGKIEEASGGTVFLDEIADIPLHVQTKLLRFLQEKQIDRVGTARAITVDTRVIAATNRNLQQMVNDGTFREDLYYRLNVFPIVLPPLRDRLEDVPLLAEHFLKKHQLKGRDVVSGISPSILHAMMNYAWPGNVRELENLIKRAIIRSEGPTIVSMDIPGQTGTAPSGLSDSPATTNVPYKTYLGQVVKDAERKFLLRALRECKGNLNQAARMLEVDRKTIYRKIDEFRINISEFKGQ